MVGEHGDQLTHPAAPGEHSAVRWPDAGRHNLPRQTTPLIGRTVELAAIAAALDADRLVTLVGAAGIGKTRLAIHAAAERVDRHADGVVFVELAPVNEPDAVAPTLAGLLRVWETRTEPTVDAICRFVADRSMLIVLDNCEHLIDASADLALRLLAACPELTILATSREPLGVPGEIAWRVPSLPAPASDQRLDLVELSGFDAIRLFADRACRARPGFALTELNSGAIVEICSRLDGIPLALELAAARCRTMTPERIAVELDRRFVMLTGGARTALARQQTLLASIAWSHELLAADERIVFRRLGAFTGLFPLEAAEAVCGEADDAGWAVFDVLCRLVDKSLVQHDPDTGWYRLLESIRLYAIERCGDAGEVEATRDRHAAWWMAWLDAHHADAPSDGDLDTIELGYVNLRAALRWVADTQPELALELAGGLGNYWHYRGLLSDAITLGDLALTSAPHGPDWARTVGRVAASRYYANDAEFMTTVVPEACEIADRCGDQVTPLRCRATLIFAIDELEEFRALARTAESCGERWIAARMQVCIAAWDQVLDRPEAHAELERLLEYVEELDTSSLRFGARAITARHLAAELRVRDAIAELEHAMRDIDRVSPNTALHALGNLVWYRILCGETAPLEGFRGLARRSARDWGVLTGLAVVYERLPELLAGHVDWDRPDVTIGGPSPQLRWVLGDAIGEDHVRLLPTVTSTSAGDLARFNALVTSTVSAYRQGRAREAEAGAATLVRRRSEDRHFWLLMLAHCAAQAGSHHEAARLLGAVAGTQVGCGLPWLPRLLVTGRAETQQRARETLGDEAFNTAFTEGFTLDLDSAVAYALRTRGERKRPSTGWDSLTPTELQVASQVAAGRSNPEIAAALLMGRTTVKTHLAHIFTKLDITNRSELAAEATRRRV